MLDTPTHLHRTMNTKQADQPNGKKKNTHLVRPNDTVCIDNTAIQHPLATQTRRIHIQICLTNTTYSLTLLLRESLARRLTLQLEVMEALYRTSSDAFCRANVRRAHDTVSPLMQPYDYTYRPHHSRSVLLVNQYN